MSFNIRLLLLKNCFPLGMYLACHKFL